MQSPNYYKTCIIYVQLSLRIVTIFEYINNVKNITTNLKKIPPLNVKKLFFFSCGQN